jgi:hypothetical protein
MIAYKHNNLTLIPLMYTINFWPVLVAAVVAFAIGALWYSPILFGKEWMALTKTSDSDMSAKASGMWKSYIVHFIATIISFCVLAFIVASTSVSSASDGAFLGFFTWLGFVAPIGVSELLWERKPMKLILINTIQVLLGLIIGGAIIGAWK